MANNTFYKDPDEILDYVWDWSLWLAEEETITAAVVTVPDGIVKDSQTIGINSVTVWLSGGVSGKSYLIDCQITTSGLRVADRDIHIIVKDR